MRSCDKIEKHCIHTKLIHHIFMAQKQKEEKNGKDSKKTNGSKKEMKQRTLQTTSLKQETKFTVFAVIAFMLVIFCILSVLNAAGPAGTVFYSLFNKLFGVGYFLLPTVLAILGITFLGSTRPNIALMHSISSVLFLGSGLGLIDIASDTHKGGYVGQIFAFPFLKLFGVYVSAIFLVGLLMISLLLLFDRKPNFASMKDRILSLFGKKKKEIEEEPKLQKVAAYDDDEENALLKKQKEKPQEEVRPAKAEKEPKVALPEEKTDEFSSFLKPNTRKHDNGSYIYPPLSLLETDKGKPNVGDVKANLNVIKRTLINFGIEVEMDEVTIGPSVTRYALKPAEGVKLSRITGLANDLALALAAHPIRIEAPIPGKSLVGIEIPNRTKAIVGLATLLADEKFQNGQKPLLVALGRNISGRSTFGNLAKMPHALIAGATGSGKSVTIHSIITSLLYRNSPDEMRFIMVDPKRVELTLYNKIPHLLTPVITDPKKTILALKWAAKEMDRRYDILQSNSVRDLESYHAKYTKELPKNKDEESVMERLPYIVIIIDELADIMQAYPRELESAIVRLAQMSRAVGIHLILSTQRPSVNVITGLIKANVPARVALQVSSQIDSRTILDQAGAEKLLGAGDMLYSSGDMAQPERLQSAFISEEEVKKVVKFLADNARDDVPSEINLTGGAVAADNSIFSATLEDEADDDMYEEARQTVIEAGKASTSFLQRKLGVGYARAARLIDMLEDHGVVGAGNGAKPRDVLEKPAGITPEGFQ